MRHAASAARPSPPREERGSLLRDERGAATMQWVTIGALLLIAALLAYPDLSYNLHRLLGRYGLDVRIPYLFD